MALMAAGIGAVGNIAGGLLGGKPSTPKYRPFDVTTGFGTVDYDKKGRSISQTLTPEQQAFANQYGGLASQYLGGGPYGALSQQMTGMAGQQIPGLFQGALDASAMDPASLAAYQQQLGAAQGGMGNLFGLASQAGMGALNTPAAGYNQAMQMFGHGSNLAANNYQNIYDQRLAGLRQSAAPQEERAQNSFLNRMFSMGQMGNHTGGNRMIEAFATGQSQADTTRQLDAMNLSEALYGRDQANAQGFMGQGLQGLIQGAGQQANIGQGFLGLAGNLGGQYGNMAGQGYGAAQGFNEMSNMRAQQRMQNAGAMFGFGSDINTQALGMGQQLQGSQAGLFNNLFNTGAAGHAAGQGQMQGQYAAAQTFQPNAIGAGLQSFSNGILANPQAFSGMAQGIRNMFSGPAGYSGLQQSGMPQVSSGVQNIQMPNFNVLPGGGSY